jgi:superfamily I DNA and/or RNA helicase
MNNSVWNEHLSQWQSFLYECHNTVDNDGDRIKLERQMKTIERVRYAAVLNPNVLIEFINPTGQPLPKSEISDFILNLNDSQKNAVKTALGNNPLSLIQGPPGTGKTQVIAEICLQLYRKNPDIKILVCSETHIAVNNLILRISEYDDSMRIVRIRDKDRDSDLELYYPESIVGTYNEWLEVNCNNTDIKNILMQCFSNNEDKSLEKALALSANIVGMTCNRVNAYEFNSSSEMFDVVIIDEVCKATLPEILAPMTIAQKAVLVGDPKQLPPVFCSEEIEIIKNIEKCNLLNYQYIDKLFEHSNCVTVLDTQYRMNNQIGNLISSLFYSGLLKNGRFDTSSGSIVWIDYSPTEPWPRFDESNVNKPQIFNLDECRMITDLLVNLNNTVDSDTSIAIIAPYRHQVMMLRERIDSINFDKLRINIDTVDGFQGKESDIVIFSLTRTRGAFRFLADTRRLNVALSRARDKLYIVGDLEYAGSIKILNMIIEKCDVVRRKLEGH